MSVLTITFLDVKQGDSALFDLPGGHFGVIDFGNPAAGESVVAPEVQARVAKGDTFLFAAVTHFDDDHAGGLPSVLRVREPKYLMLPSIGLDLFEEWVRRLTGKPSVPSIDAVRAAQARVQTLRMVTHSPLVFREVPGIRFFALSPDHHFENELRNLLMTSGSAPPSAEKLRSMRNRGSLALYVDPDGADSLILLAEAESDQYNNIWRVVQQDIHRFYRSPMVVKLSHHGSRHNNTAETFQYFGEPGTLMVSSAGGRYSHPDITVVEQVQAVGATPACTNLGAGCSMIMAMPARPPDIAAWRAANASLLKVMPSSNPKCYGTIGVVFDGPQTTADFGTVQARCPFGGPKAQRLLLKR